MEYQIKRHFDKEPVIYNLTNTMKTKIYGIMDEYTYRGNGHQAYVIDGNTGEVIDSHFSSGEGWARMDLGFSNPLTPHGESCHENYRNRYPQGYELEWIGLWKNNPIITALRKDVTKTQ